MSSRKPTRKDLLLVVGELQQIVGSIRGAYLNDRQPERAKKVVDLCDRGEELAIAALGFDPPQSGTWRP